MNNSLFSAIHHVPRKRRALVHFASGGISHFLGLLEGSLEASRRFNAPLQVETRHHKPLGYTSFAELFQVTEPQIRLVADECPIWQSDSGIRLGTSKTGRYRSYWVSHGPRTSRLIGLNQFSFRSIIQSPLMTHGVRLPEHERFQRIVTWLVLSTSLQAQIYKVLQAADRPERKYIGVHFRNSDRRTDPDDTLRKIDRRSTEYGLREVWLGSDDPSALEFFRRKRPHLSIQGFDKPFISTGQNLHFGVSKSNARSQMVFALADLFMLSHSSTYVPAQSSGSGWIRLVSALRLGNQDFFGQGLPANKKARNG